MELRLVVQRVTREIGPSLQRVTERVYVLQRRKSHAHLWETVPVVECESLTQSEQEKIMRSGER